MSLDSLPLKRLAAFGGALVILTGGGLLVWTYVVPTRSDSPTPPDDPQRLSSVPSPEPIPGARYTSPRRTTRSDDHHLAAFFRAVTRAESPDESERVSVLEIGDSHAAGDAFSAHLRRLFGPRIGLAGRGYAHPGIPWEGFRQEQMSYDMSRNWTPALAVDSADSGPFGLGGVRLETRAAGAWLSRGACDECSALSHFNSVAVHYLRHPSGGRFRISVDGESLDVVETEGERGLGVYRTSVTRGRRLRIEVLGGGRVALFGLRTRRESDGLEYSSLGLNGAEISDFASIEPDLVRAQLRRLDPDLLAFSFGTNSAYNLQRFLLKEGANQTLVRRRFEQYRRQFRTVLERHLEAAPEASCLMLLPPDLAPSRKPCGASRVRFCEFQRPETFERIVAIQRAVAEDVGCAIWDRARAMGGETSIRTWAERDPSLARSDGVHLTIDGYRILARGLFIDMSDTLADWKAGKGTGRLETHPVFPTP